MKLVLKLLCVASLIVAAGQIGSAAVVTYSFSSPTSVTVEGMGPACIDSGSCIDVGPVSLVAEVTVSSIAELESALTSGIGFYNPSRPSGPYPGYLPLTSASSPEPLIDLAGLLRDPSSPADLLLIDFAGSDGASASVNAFFNLGALTANGTYQASPPFGGSINRFSGTLTVSGVPDAVPEPASVLLLGAGLGAIALGVRRRSSEAVR